MRDLSEIQQLPTLTQGDVTLRPFRDEDAATVAAVCDNEAAARWIPGLPSPYTLDDGREWVSDAARKWRDERWANFAALDTSTGRHIANCGLHLETEHARGEIGYIVSPEWRSRGVCRACIAALTDWGFDDLGLERIEIRADVRNVASRRTAAGSGYRYEGVLRGAMTVQGERVDDALYALVPADPRPWHGGQTAGKAPADEPQPAVMGWPRLTDGRLLVRPFEPDDAPAVAAACDDPELAHWIHGLPAPYELADAERFIADARHRLLLDERARLAVTAAATGEVLGSVSLDRHADREAAEIGYWVKREARRRGVALGAARLIVDWAFAELGVERLELLTYPGNEASQALAGRLGFTRECLLRGYLAPETAKSRGGRVVPSQDGSLPPRDDQVLFVRPRSDPAASA
jgi:RimJ/RimL family protein N-acetyltransferase